MKNRAIEAQRRGAGRPVGVPPTRRLILDANATGMQLRTTGVVYRRARALSRSVSRLLLLLFQNHLASHYLVWQAFHCSLDAGSR